MLEPLGATWSELATVVVTTAGMYAAFIVLVRVVGQRSLAGMSSFDVGCIVALGAVMGRTVLLAQPTLLIGVVAIATFFAVQGTLGVLRQVRAVDRLMNRAPVVLMRDGALLPDAMRRAHVSADEVRQRLRLAGVCRLQDVAVMTLERNGSVSVLRAGPVIDPWLLSDLDRAPGTA